MPPEGIMGIGTTGVFGFGFGVGNTTGGSEILGTISSGCFIIGDGGSGNFGLTQLFSRSFRKSLFTQLLTQELDGKFGHSLQQRSKVLWQIKIPRDS